MTSPSATRRGLRAPGPDRPTGCDVSRRRSKPARKRLNKVAAAADIDYDDDDCDEFDLQYDDLNAISAIRKSGILAILFAKLNGHRIKMLYDPGAAYSVTGKTFGNVLARRNLVQRQVYWRTPE